MNSPKDIFTQNIRTPSLAFLCGVFFVCCVVCFRELMLTCLINPPRGFFATKCLLGCSSVIPSVIFLQLPFLPILPLKTISIHGYLGSGKNVLMTMLLWMYKRSSMQRHVWANYYLKQPYFNNYTFIQTMPRSDTESWKYVSLDYLYRVAMLGIPLPFESNVVGFDEMQYINDSRDHQDKSHEIMSYLEIQGRKRKTVYVWISKKSKLVDVRTRDRDIAFECYKHHYGTGRICFEDTCMEPHWFQYDKLDLRNGRGRTINLTAQQVAPFFKMYNTEEMLAPITGYGYKEADLLKMLKEFDSGGQV
jgi:hypothetical protein